ncbi:hypothetical protein KY342_05565 [Candidatus Woesearchaeota archaeon]|nr:hypothetical protein [Candidatus Woesearchaeota archaeon]
MNLEKLAKRIEGLQTVSSICKLLKIDKRTAINYISMLRKKGFLETMYGKRRIRMYKISPAIKKKVGYPGLYEIINKHSKVKIIGRYEHKVYAHKLTVEEAIIRAIKTKGFRVILAALGLFNKIENWQLINKLSKKENIGRKIGALYDIARKSFRVKRMDERTRKSLLKSKVDGKYIIDRIKSKDFKNIEKIWKVYIPFNKADLEVYKE